MTEKAPSIDLAAWLQTPPGRHLLAWEQAQVDAAVVDLFGFHALQLGLPELDGLQANRMPHRWLAGRDVLCEFDALPFESASLDLVLLPHALELACDAHALLREVERVLRPEGRLIVFGLNPASLWGLRQNLGRLRRRGEPYLPRDGEFIGYWRLRDWLQLLSFDVEAARFGVYRPPMRSEAWLHRWRWIDGDQDMQDIWNILLAEAVLSLQLQGETIEVFDDTAREKRISDEMMRRIRG